ncbi:DNA-directed DNA polymerase [Senna tora]|uniref:DNA-directed DNA polymerase n=1 Tax=Senna tora TaxID=362788 RepID=A0A834VXL6_9FABA|nr:DNA-directed DNA polymerase [Senna tora]
MAEEKTLKELDAPLVQQTPLCITATTLQAPLGLKSGLIHLLPKFRGLANEDPYNHLKEFHVVCSSMKPDKITEDQIKLRAFPFSLEDAAKKLLFYLLAGSITSWEQMMKTFLGGTIPLPGCPQHGIPEQALINFFYEGKGELTMRIQDAQVTFNMLNPIKSPKENEKSLKIEAAKEGESKAAIDGDLNNHQIDPGEKSQKYLTEIDAADQFGGPTMLKAPPWCNKSKSPHHINQELPFTPGVQKNITGRDTRNGDSCKVISTPCALIDPG